jgi:hypothetical protein
LAKKTSPAPSKDEPTEIEPATPLGGRPSSYLPEYTRQVLVLCAYGATDQELAEFFQVSTRTINRWKITHPEFADAIRRGKDSADDRVQDSLYHRAMGIEYEREQPMKLKKVTYDDKGKKVSEEERIEVVMVKEVIPADTTALIFWLKNRRPDKWRDVHKHEHGKPGDFDGMTKEQLDDFIRSETQELGFVESAKRGRATQH